MPNYIYQCENRHTLSLDHSIFDEPQVTCTLCHTPMSRKPQTVSSQFIGSGFYSTDKGNA